MLKINKFYTKIRQILDVLCDNPNLSEIDKVRNALRRYENIIDDMQTKWSHDRLPCCPSCAFGQKYSQAVEKSSRTAQWLKHLLQKRGTKDDLTEIEHLKLDYPKCIK